ncbi:hypothetical protein GCK72_015854 [Caenorhabditis remanei]|uniref:Uncharacterized protein n=1 Tax=Caenorhabditis remanei TaxID=31234 RepID=A0A6A5GW57_CAERE|nr:hypothetical protein GCK72_015854 [Caenorhabditis remanei]KAF1759387.1 hypothetical protein GCK72_015854 [Caenorhabditis remanei]
MCLGPWTPKERIEKLEAELEFERNQHEETKSQLLEKELENQRLLAEIEKLKLSASKKKKKPCRRHVKKLQEQLKEIPEATPINLTPQEDSEDTQKTSEAQMMYLAPITMNGLYQTLGLRPQMVNMVPNKVLPRQSSALVLKALEEAEALEKASKDHELENLEILEETDSEDTQSWSDILETQKDPEFSEKESEDTHQPSEISETLSKIASLDSTRLLNLKYSFIF